MILLFLKIDLVSYKSMSKYYSLFKKFFFIYMSCQLSQNPPPHLSHASPMYERNEQMHEMKCKRGKVTDTLGRKNPQPFHLPIPIQKRFNTLTIYLKVISILGVTDLNCAVWKHGFDSEWPSPSRFQFSQKKMKPRIIE